MNTSEHLQPNSYFTTDTDLTTITITSAALKKGRPVTKTLDARRTKIVNDGLNSCRLYIIDKTNRDFQRWRFPLEEGCIIDDETGSYEVLSVHSPMKNPKIPCFYTKQVT